MSEKHTPEPWKPCKVDAESCMCREVWSLAHDIPVAYCLDKADESWTAGDGATRETAMANARRIASCVNAMKGIEDPEAFVAGVRELSQAGKELHEAHEDVLHSLNRGALDGEAQRWQQTALKWHKHALYDLLAHLPDTEDDK